MKQADFDVNFPLDTFYYIVEGTGALPAYQIPGMAAGVLKQKLEVLASELRNEIEESHFN
jgi:hypothetical protein